MGGMDLSWLLRRTTLDELKGDWGLIQTEWESLKSQAEPGDEWWVFASPQDTWNRLAGSGGFALVRNGEIVGHIVTIGS